MLPCLIYFWYREEFVTGINSYASVVPEYSPAFSPLKRSKYETNVLENIDKHLMLENKGYNNKMYEIFMGSPCDYIEVTNCHGTILRRGLHAGLQDYKSVVYGSEVPISVEEVLKLETMSEDMQSGYMESLNAYFEIESAVYEENWRSLLLIVGIVIGLFMIFHLVFLFRQAEDLYVLVNANLTILKLLLKFD